MYHTSSHFQGNFVRLMIGSTFFLAGRSSVLILQVGAWHDVGPKMTKRGLYQNFGMARELEV